MNCGSFFDCGPSVACRARDEGPPARAKPRVGEEPRAGEEPHDVTPRAPYRGALTSVPLNKEPKS